MESDREQDDRLTGRMGEVFRPCEVFFPSPLVQAMQQDNRLIILLRPEGVNMAYEKDLFSWIRSSVIGQNPVG